MDFPVIFKLCAVPGFDEIKLTRMGYSVRSDIINTHDKMRLNQKYFRILLIILLVKVFSIPQLLAGQDIILKVKILQDLVCVILQNLFKMIKSKYLDVFNEIINVENITTFLSEVYVRTSEGNKIVIESSKFKLRY